MNLVWDRCVGDLNRSLDQFSENKGCIIVIVNMFKMAPSCNKSKGFKILELLGTYVSMMKFRLLKFMCITCMLCILFVTLW